VRIALIAPLVTPISDRHLGGAQAVLADLARALTSRRHDVVVYAARGSAIGGVTMAAVDIDSTLLRDDLFRAGRDTIASAAMLASYRTVYEHVRRERFDVVHNHGFDAPAISVAADMDVPVLHTLHLPPSRTVADAIDRACRGDTAVCCAAVSESHAASWGRWVSVDAVLRNGVPTDEITFHAQSERSAVIAARFSAEKGVDEGIAAARMAGWPVDVYGTAYDDAYEEMVRRRWAADAAVRFHAPVPRTQLWEALGTAAAALSLSRWEEPFGMVAAEAQAAGTPVVASRLGGLAEVVQDEVTGHLVPAGDVAAAAEALGRIHALSRLRCREHAEAALSLDGAADRHEALYSRIVARGTPR
jgi:UDP-glucose:tetrahydrobiopterin glucosyltransferase